MLFFAGGFLGLVAIGFWLFCLFDALTSPSRRIRGLPKLLWILVIVVGLDLGGVLWLIFGRPREGLPGRADRDPADDPWRNALELGRSHRRNTPKRAVAPDDDPDFLRSLDHRRHPGDD